MGLGFRLTSPNEIIFFTPKDGYLNFKYILSSEDPLVFFTYFS
jgi:hypothetical protein